MLTLVCLRTPSRTVQIGLSLAIVALVAGISHAAAPPVRPGDNPLPRHARLRLGTARFRVQGPFNADLSSDGKTLAVADSPGLVLYDMATGAVRRTLPSFLRTGEEFLVFCDRGRKLIAGGYEGVRVWDTTSGRLMNEWLQEGRIGRPKSCSADGRRFAIIYYSGDADLPHQIVVRDLPGKKEVARILVWCAGNPQVAISPDGNRLAVGGTYRRQAGAQRADRSGRGVQVWDLVTGKETLRFDAGSAVNTISFSPNGKLLVVAVSGGEKKPVLEMRDAATGKLRWSASLAWYTRLEWSSRVGFSADGRRVYAVTSERRLGIWETATGKEFGRHGVAVYDSAGMKLLADGRAVAWGRKGLVLRLWDPLTGKILTPVGGHTGALNALAFTAHGKALCVLDDEGNLIRWNTQTGQMSATIDLQPHLGQQAPHLIVLQAAFAPGASELVVPVGEELFVVDPTTGKARKKPGTTIKNINYSYAWRVTCSADGTRFAAFSKPYGFNGLRVPATPLFWDRRTRKAKEGASVWFGDKRQCSGTVGALSGDGTRAAMVTNLSDPFDATFDSPRATIELSGWDLVKRKKLSGRKLTGTAREVSLVVAPDGRTAVLAMGGKLYLSDLLTGKPLGVIRGAWEHVTAGPLFSPDGRILALATRDGPLYTRQLKRPTVRLIEWASRAERRRFEPDTVSHCLAFSLDGQTLASGQVDTTILLWDVRGREERPGVLTPAQLWATLGQTDAAVARQAIEELSDRPDVALSLLRARLKAARAIRLDAAAVRKQIAQLDASTLKEREAARRQLERWRWTVEADVRKAVAARSSLEVLRRLERLLDALDRPTAEEVLHTRCVEILERIGSAEAKKLLRQLADGDPLQVLTREARAALGRLDRRDR
jgi:WD40 repeat protein